MGFRIEYAPATVSHLEAQTFKAREKSVARSPAVL
jgi:hypothetical protein